MKKTILTSILFSALLSSHSVLAYSGDEEMAALFGTTAAGATLGVSGLIDGGALGMSLTIAGVLFMIRGMEKEQVYQLRNDAQVYMATGKSTAFLEAFVETTTAKFPELSADEIVESLK